jgi:cytochrome c biogenesis protein CcmG, thiol:disulfide interchange protein DsbE
VEELAGDWVVWFTCLRRAAAPATYYRNVAQALHSRCKNALPGWRNRVLFWMRIGRNSVRFVAAVCVVVGVLASGCDRGSNPRQIGRAAPDFVVRDGAQTVQLSAYRGKIVLLNFWASWCQPCVEELPSLLDLHHQMPQLVVLAVSTDEDADAYRQFLIDNRVDLLSVRDAQQASNNLYGTHAFPESYLIDRNGVVRRKFIGAQDWNSPEIRAYIQRM